MRRLADLLEEIFRWLRHFVVIEAEHQLEIRYLARAGSGQLARELIELEEAVHCLLGEDEGVGRSGGHFGERGAGRFWGDERKHVAEVPRAMTEEGGEKRAFGRMIRHPQGEPCEVVEVLKLIREGESPVRERVQRIPNLRRSLRFGRD